MILRGERVRLRAFRPEELEVVHQARLRSTGRVAPPDAPIGWPSATAPPFTLTISGSAPSIRAELSATDENASFSSMRLTSPIAFPARASACAPALAGVRAR